MDESERLRLWLTFAIAALGFLVVLAAFVIAVLAFKNEDKPGQIIPAVLGVVTAAVGTLAGLIAGHTAGAAGKERAERRADSREREASNGRALALTLVQDEMARAEPAASGTEAVGSPGRVDDESVIHRHAEMARRMFPA